MPRVGAVQYLNTRPLVHGLSDHDLDLCYDLPSRLADRLADGSLDVALIPTVELFRSPGHTIVSNACIGCLGPVMSVKLFFRVAPSAVTTLAVDEGSRTSAALSRILLAERYHVHPAVSVLPIGANLCDTNADAVLLIGDRALGPGPGSVGGGSVQVVWDLGDEWLKWTGLPFVFAVWAAREGVDATGLVASLESARDTGVANLAAIAAAEAAGHGLTVPQCLAYLRDNLHFHLGERERSGLSRFRAHAERLGLVPSRETVTVRSVGTTADRHTV
ncbi:MAG: menaquinone biosynthetic enzyme MqnA/MqnD family protein [Planctomycetaceae bacterium]